MTERTCIFSRSKAEDNCNIHVFREYACYLVTIIILKITIFHVTLFSIIYLFNTN